MKLQSVRVTNFRSVEDSGEFSVAQVTALVGKNEAGKTAILTALAGLNPHPATPVIYDKERDYPRRFLTEYDERHDGKEARVIETKWSLDESERAKLVEAVGADAVTDECLVVRRSYGDSRAQYSPPIDLRKALDNLIRSEKLSEEECEPLSGFSNTAALKQALEAIETRTDNQERLLQRIKSFPEQTITGLAKAAIGPTPQFLYSSHYDRMEGQIRVDNFSRRQKEGKDTVKVGELIFVDFLEYAGTSIEEISASETYEGLNARCEAASNRITEQLQEYWTQNPNLEIEVRVTKAEPKDPAPHNEGVIARARVKNNLHKVTVPFSERSAGFVWFFSFLVKFAQVKRSGDNLVLLLDEPGLTLHGKAQADLLRYFDEKLAPSHQVMFSTHSPFMVPVNQWDGIRIVEDHVTQTRPGRWVSDGTKVRADVLRVDRDTLFPLQSALGYEVTQSLFVGKNVLLVEGPGDILFLQALSRELIRRGRKGLDARWTLCPAGGIDKIGPFVSLFSGSQINIAAITDFAHQDRRKLDALRQSGILEASRLLTYAAILDREEADVEDLFDPSLYADILTGAFSLENHVIASDLVNADATSRLVKKAESYFRVLPPNAPEFDHFTPAGWLFEHPDLLMTNSEAVDATLARAEKVVGALNGILEAVAC